MVGGILCERTVEEVMPALVLNTEQVKKLVIHFYQIKFYYCFYLFYQLTKVIENINEQLTKKGSELNEYKEKYQIRIQGQDDIQQDEAKETKRNAVVVNPVQV